MARWLLLLIIMLIRARPGTLFKKTAHRIMTELKKQSHECIIYRTRQAMYLSIINVNVINWF
jgi:hypothetical protein